MRELGLSANNCDEGVLYAQQFEHVCLGQSSKGKLQ